MAPLYRYVTHNLGLFAAVIVLLLSQGCSPKIPATSSVGSQPPTETKAAPAATIPPHQPEPTSTLIPPTPTLAVPTPTTVDHTFSSQFIARLNMGEIEAFDISPLRDLLAVASASHTCLFSTSNYERIWCNLSVPPIQMVTPENAGTDITVRRMSFSNDGEHVGIALWNGYIIIFDTMDGE